MFHSIKSVTSSILGGHGVFGPLPKATFLDENHISDPMELVHAITFTVLRLQPGLFKSKFVQLIAATAILMALAIGVYSLNSYLLPTSISFRLTTVTWISIYIICILVLAVAAICFVAAIARPVRFGLKRYHLQTVVDLDVKNRVLRLSNRQTVLLAKETVDENVKEETSAAEALFPTKQGILAAVIAIAALLFSQRVVGILERNPISWQTKDMLLAVLWASGVGLIAAGLVRFIGLQPLKRTSRILGYALHDLNPNANEVSEKPIHRKDREGGKF